ncbi:CHASE2 domain-containing protein [Rhizobium sp. YIM 134829]|uniref:CHASE2 domain-containing protein n=1 Tax=Rhizobium sp. YIM 134829 TaxID=3390453 RepID=UPI00397825A5
MAVTEAKVLKAARAPDVSGSDQRRRRLGLLLLLPVVVLLLTLASLTPAWRLIELRSYDLISTLSAPDRPADGPVVVAIDEPSMSEVGAQWPWPRALHARLVTALRAAGAKAIGLDIIFAERSADPANDTALAAVLGPDVVLAGDETTIRSPQADQFIRTEPLPALVSTGAKIGIASVQISADGVLRHLPAFEDGFARRLVETAGRRPVVPGGTALIQTFGPPRTYQTISYYQALEPDLFLPPGFLKDRVVMVGLSLQNAPSIDAGGADTFVTADTIRTGLLTAGVEVQATIYDNLANSLFIREGDRPTIILSILFGALLAALVAFRATGWQSTALTILFLPMLVAACLLMMRIGGVFVSPAGPVGAYLLVMGAQSGLDFAAERRRRRDITAAFASYLSPAVVARLAADPTSLKLGGERRTLSILFCDVRGFTTISETLKDDPEQLTTLINRLLTPLSEIVLASGGTIDKYIGDCIMAFWNAPLDVPDHALQAVRSALAMLEAIEVLNGDLAAEAAAAGRPAPPPLKIGIGINTGECVVGNMGSARRFDYSVLGDSVNLASRLEGESKNYGVPLLIGASTAEAIAHALPVAELDSIKVKGRTILSPVFTVLPDADPAALLDHAAFLHRKYELGLSPDDPGFAVLPARLPGLSRYYALVRDRLG